MLGVIDESGSRGGNHDPSMSNVCRRIFDIAKVSRQPTKVLVLGEETVCEKGKMCEAAATWCYQASAIV